MPVSMKDKKRSYAGYLGSLGSTEGAPANTVPPEVQGTPKVGSLVIASRGRWDNVPAPVFTYQWQVGGVDVSGETGQRYAIAAGSENDVLTVVVTATNSEGATSETSASVIVQAAPTNTAPPAITGTAKEGETLTVDLGTWGGEPVPEYAVEWFADGDAITGADELTYIPVADDVGKVITVTVTATNMLGSASETSAATAAVIAEDDPNEG